MSIISGKKILENARKNNYAVPAFGFVNLEGAKAIVQAAEEMKSPVIMQTTEGGINYAGHDELIAIATSLAKKASVPISIHLDHGKNLNIIQASIEKGYTSVMYDGSELPVHENIENSIKVKNIIGNKGISIETELGLIGGKEDDMETKASSFTTSQEAKIFIDKVQPDALAIACGTAHGKYSKEVNIQFNLIKEISDANPNTSIVLHGGSWVPLDQITKAVQAGATKVNFDSELKQSFINSIMEYMKENKNEYDIRKIFSPAINSQKEIAITKIKACMSNDRG